MLGQALRMTCPRSEEETLGMFNLLLLAQQLDLQSGESD
jgi:hypothetical protein